MDVHAHHAHWTVNKVNKVKSEQKIHFYFDQKENN